MAQIIPPSPVGSEFGSYNWADWYEKVRRAINASATISWSQIVDFTGGGILPVAKGGTGTPTPGLIAGTNITITGAWPNSTINSTGGISKFGKSATWDGLGVAIISGNCKVVRCAPAQATGTILSATAQSDVAGSCTVEVWKTTYAAAPATVANKISSAAPITLSSAIKSQDSTLTGWTTSVTVGDIICFHVLTSSTIGWLEVSLEIG